MNGNRAHSFVLDLWIFSDRSDYNIDIGFYFRKYQAKNQLSIEWTRISVSIKNKYVYDIGHVRIRVWSMGSNQLESKIYQFNFFPIKDRESPQNPENFMCATSFVRKKKSKLTFK